jgi:hypothetical protein
MTFSLLIEHAQLVPSVFKALHASHALFSTLTPNPLLRIVPQRTSPLSEFGKYSSSGVRPSSVYFLALRFISLPSSFPNVVTSLWPIFTRRTSGHCLGTFTTVNLSLFLRFHVVSLKTPQLCFSIPLYFCLLKVKIDTCKRKRRPSTNAGTTSQY